MDKEAIAQIVRNFAENQIVKGANKETTKMILEQFELFNTNRDNIKDTCRGKIVGYANNVRISADNWLEWQQLCPLGAKAYVEEISYSGLDCWN